MMKRYMGRLILNSLFFMTLSSCVLDETDYAFIIKNASKESLSLEYKFINTKEISGVAAQDSLTMIMTWYDQLGPKLEENEFNDNIFIKQITTNSGQSVSDSVIAELNKVSNWSYDMTEDTKNWHQHLYKLTLSDSTLGLE